MSTQTPGQLAAEILAETATSAESAGARYCQADTKLLRAVLADNERLTAELATARERAGSLLAAFNTLETEWVAVNAERDQLRRGLGFAEQDLAEVKAKLAAASRAAAASAELDAELTAAKRRLEVAYRREDDLRGAYEAAWAERNEARGIAHSLYAAATDMAGRPWSMCALADVDPALAAEALPDWLTDDEPPAADGAQMGAEGAWKGRGGDLRAPASPAARGVEIEP